jgi:hypothetical protein
MGVWNEYKGSSIESWSMEVPSHEINHKAVMYMWDTSTNVLCPFPKKDFYNTMNFSVENAVSIFKETNSSFDR